MASDFRLRLPQPRRERQALLCAVIPAVVLLLAGWLERTSYLRRSKWVLYSDHLPVENSWLHTRKKRLAAQLLNPQTSEEEKKLVGAAFPHQRLQPYALSLPVFVSVPPFFSDSSPSSCARPHQGQNSAIPQGCSNLLAASHSP